MRYMRIPKDVTVGELMNHQTGSSIPDITFKCKPFLLERLGDPKWRADEAGTLMAMDLIEKIEAISGPDDILEMTDAEQEKLSKVAREPTEKYADPFATKLMRFIAAICSASKEKPAPERVEPTPSTESAPLPAAA